MRKRALVTGASSGIGAAYARALASRGYDLILVARRQTRLEGLAAELGRQFHIGAEVLVADLSDPIDVARVEKRVAELDRLDFLVNNAGYGLAGRFADVPIDRIVDMIQCHVLASVRLARAALPGMLSRKEGAIVNVSSVSAFMPNRGNATYSPTKAYLIAFTEALYDELAGTGVRVQALCPGFTHTELHDGPEYAHLQVKTKIPKWLWMNPEQIVSASLKALERDRVICVPGWKYRLIVAAARVGMIRALARILRIFLRRKVAPHPGETGSPPSQ